MAQTPLYLDLLFVGVTILSAWLFYRAAKRSRPILIAVVAWLLLHAIVASTGFYTNTTILPPRFLLLIGPPLLFIITLFATRSGRRFLDGLNLEVLTLIHAVRLPVELTLLGLFLHGAIPQLMTFEGRNYDILSGVTAPIIWWAIFRTKALPRWAFLTWNLICLGLLFNIVTIAILSAPFPFQALAFDHPNTGVFYFPYVWLPGFIVPLVLLAHLTAIRAYFLMQHKKSAHEVPIRQTMERVG